MILFKVVDEEGGPAQRPHVPERHSDDLASEQPPEQPDGIEQLGASVTADDQPEQIDKPVWHIGPSAFVKGVRDAPWDRLVEGIRSVEEMIQ